MPSSIPNCFGRARISVDADPYLPTWPSWPFFHQKTLGRDIYILLEEVDLKDKLFEEVGKPV